MRTIDTTIKYFLNRVFICMAAAFSASPLPAVSPYQVKGTIIETSYHRNATVRKQISTRFVVEVTGSKWRIRTYFGPDSNYFEEYMFDGVDTYGILFDPMAGKTSTVPASAANSYQPTHAFCTTRLAWLAFASSIHFDREPSKRETLIVPWGTTSNPGAQDCVTHFRLMDSVFKLPSQLTYNWSISAWTNECREKRLDARASPFLDTEVVGSYSVQSFTNANNIILPMAFELTRLHKDSMSSTPRMLEHFQGRGEEYSVGSFDLNRPVIDRPAYVLDTRIVAPERRFLAIQYTVTNNTWPERADPRLALLLAKAERQYPAKLESLFPAAQPAAGGAKKAVILFFLLLVAMMLPITIVIYNRKRTGALDPTHRSQ